MIHTLGAPSRASFEALSQSKGSLFGSKLYAAAAQPQKSAQFPQASRGTLAISAAAVATEVDARSLAGARRSLDIPVLTVRIAAPLGSAWPTHPLPHTSLQLGGGPGWIVVHFAAFGNFVKARLSSRANHGHSGLAVFTEQRTGEELRRRFTSTRLRSYPQVVPAFPEGSGSLPEVLYRLLDPAASVELPAPGAVQLRASDNRELDKLVAALGRNKSTWRRALMLHEWLLEVRLCCVNAAVTVVPLLHR